MGSCKVAVVKRALSVEGLFYYPYLGICRRFPPTFCAGGKGFEPLLADPESAVLPLDEPPNNQRAVL
jgi:hypothetical protein